MKHRSYTRLWFRALVCAAAIESCGVVAAATEPPVEAVDFSSQVVFRSKRPPGYAAWVSFFPGENGQWYIGCEEVSLPEEPLPQTSPEQWYGMGLPSGYDKSQYLMEAVLLESTDEIKTWHLISHEPYRHQHAVGQFATARTRDGRFLRFNWAYYSLDPSFKTNEILRESNDNGKTWRNVPPFHPGAAGKCSQRRGSGVCVPDGRGRSCGLPPTGALRLVR